MKKLFAISLILLVIFSARKVHAQVNVQDSLVLVDFYNSTGGPHWIRTDNWLTKSPVSTWYGVTVTANRVTTLNSSPIFFGGNNLTGSIPDSIGYLTNLTYLDLSNNKLSGDIPASFGNLTNLHYLNLTYNHLTGSISFLTKLHNPHDIELVGNQFTGKIPKLNDLNLSVLNLEANYLSGSIPRFGKDTASIISINLNDNKLTGGISHQFDSLANLYELFLERNQLNGNISASLNKFSILHEIVLDQNQLTGKLPVLDNLKNLDLISVAYNKLSGNIPASLNKNTKLYFVDLSNNNFSGRLPSLDSLDPGTSIYLQNNQFTFSGMEGIASHFPSTYYTIYAPQANINIQHNGNRLSVAAGGTILNNTYYWYKNGVLFKTKTGNAGLTVNGNGDYSVAVTNSIATQLTLNSDTVSVTNLLQQNSDASIEARGDKFFIYPNPVKTVATISFKATGDCTITLTDLSGNILQTKKVAGKGVNVLQLDLSKYAAGMYFVAVINEAESQTLQLIKE